MTIRDRDRDRETYRFTNSPREFMSDGECLQCGGEIERWTEEVPCCGPPFECTDTVYVYACDRCQIMGDSF